MLSLQIRPIIDNPDIPSKAQHLTHLYQLLLPMIIYCNLVLTINAFFEVFFYEFIFAAKSSGVDSINYVPPS